MPTPTPPGTMFPALDGSEPGTHPDKAELLPDQGAPDLLPPSSDMIPASQNSPVPAPQSVPSNTPSLNPDRTNTGRRSIQERINQLTRRYHASEGERDQLANQVQELQRQLLAMQTTTMASPQRPSAPAPSTAFNPNPPASDPGDTSPLTVDSVRRVVNEAITHFTTEQQRRDQAARQLAETQQRSFQDAAEEFPELNDPQSPVHRTFMDLYRSSPIRNLPDAPYQLALQVRGLLADEAQSVRQQEGRKVAATIITPSPAVVDNLPNQNRTGAQKVYEDLNALQRQRRLTFAEYKQWRDAREVLKQQR